MLVLLINPLASRTPAECLGLEMLVAIAKRDGFQVSIIDFNLEQISIDEFQTRLIALNPFIIGITMTELSIDITHQLLSSIRKKLADVHITVGGYYPSYNYAEILQRHCEIDCVVRGEGEATFSELLSYVANSKDWKRIAGIAYREKKEIKVTATRRLIDDLDQLPFADREYYFTNKNKLLRDIPHIYSSRGCFGHCSFCSIHPFYGMSMGNIGWRSRSAENVIEEIEQLKDKYGYNEFVFFDDNFVGTLNYGKIRAERFAKNLIDNNINITYSISTRPDNVDIELFKLLKLSGLKHVFIGIESFIPRILKLYAKGISVEANIRAIEILKSLNISTEIGFIMFNPYITYDELRANYEMLKKIRKGLMITTLNLELEIYKGQPLEKKLRKENRLCEFKDCFYSYQMQDDYVQLVYNIVKEKEVWFMNTYNKIKDLKRYSKINDTSKTEAINQLYISIQDFDFEYFEYVLYNVSDPYLRDNMIDYRKRMQTRLSEIDNRANKLLYKGDT